jgi:hypothetical protein
VFGSHPLTIENIKMLNIIITLLFTFSINAHVNNAKNIHTVSGISSGGFMAVQHHVAFSSSVSGAGVVAGGPFWCAEAKLPIAITSCMTTPSLISIPELVTITKTTALTGFIDPPINLVNDAVWLFSGLKDTVVNTGVVHKTLEYYSALKVKNIVMVNNIEAEHAMPTLNYGNNCSHKGEPYINNCNFDGAGDILKHLYNQSGTMLPPVTPVDSNVIEFNQTQFHPSIGNWTLTGMAKIGYAYVPKACFKHGRRLIFGTEKDSKGQINESGSGGENGATTASCRLHVAYHGCLQNHAAIGNDFILHAGYNGWAEANSMVILYPQTEKNILNPKGCWDWWGFTGPQYASNVGIQLVTVRNIIRRYFNE